MLRLFGSFVAGTPNVAFKAASVLALRELKTITTKLPGAWLQFVKL